MTDTRPVVTVSRGVPGSLQWGMDHGRCYDVKGIYRYGRTFADCDSHQQAAQFHLIYDCAWNDETFSFIAPETLTVLKVGPWDYMRHSRVEFVVRAGVA